MAKEYTLPEDMVISEEELRKTLEGVSSQQYLDKYFKRPKSTRGTGKAVNKKHGGSVCARPTGKGMGAARTRSY